MRFLKLPEVITMTGKCRSTIYKEIAEGTFPKSIPLGGRSVAWVLSEIEQWMKEKINQR